MGRGEVGLSTGLRASGGDMGDSLGSCAAFPEGEEGTEAGSGMWVRALVRVG